MPYIGIQYYAPMELVASDDEKQIPMLLRRRLSPLERATFAAIFRHLTAEQIALVDCIATVSRYGNLDHIIKLLQDINQQEELSPMQFSTSVHNNLAGMICLGLKLALPYTALCAKDTLATMASELIGLYGRPYQHILALCYDNENPGVTPIHLLYTHPLANAPYIWDSRLPLISGITANEALHA